MANKRENDVMEHPGSKSDVDVIDPKPRHPVAAEIAKDHAKDVAKDVVRDAINPLAANNIGDLLDPDAVQGTHFTGPLISGNMDDGVPGIAVMHKRAKFTFQTGNFSFALRFPPSAILLQNVLQIQQSFAGATTAVLNLGTTLNGLDIISMDLTVAPTQLTNNMATILGSTWQIFVNYKTTGPAATAGKATLMITYSVPAKVIPS